MTFCRGIGALFNEAVNATRRAMTKAGSMSIGSSTKQNRNGPNRRVVGSDQLGEDISLFSFLFCTLEDLIDEPVFCVRKLIAALGRIHGQESLPRNQQSF